MTLIPRFGPRFGPGGGRLFATFAVLSLLPVLVLGSLLAVQYRHEVQSRGIDQATAQANVIARLLGETQLNGHSLSIDLTNSERQRLTSFTADEVLSGNVIRLRLRAPDQQVVFSNDDSDPSQRLDVDVAEALRGRSVAEVTRLNTDSAGPGETDKGTDGRSAGIRTVEAYTPLRNPHTHAVIGVLEIYLPYEAIAREVDAGLHRLYLTLGLGLALLYLVLAGLSGWTTQRLGRQALRYQHLATHDPLTDLPNRTLFVDRIAQAAAACARTGAAAGVVLLDLDRFREVNDTLGHTNGDLLLAGIAQRLRDSVRAVDTVARLGGDEFGLLLPGIGDEEQIRTALVGVRAAIEDEVDLAGLALNLEASFGVAFIPGDGDDADLLIQHADIAMYEAKRTRGGVVCYDRGQDHYDAGRLALVAELRHAIQRGELVLHYQPQIHQPDGEVLTLEALVRWQHPTRGLLAPDTFIPVAEQTGLIDELTVWVLDAALEQQRRWLAAGLELVVAVNISARSLQHGHLPQLIADALDRTGTHPDLLLLEITETALITDAAHAARILADLSTAGLRLSLDDFGQGYTSLSQLSRLPLTELKIDKSFVLNMLESSSDAAIVRSVIDLAHNLGLNVVAEGVEDDQVLQALLALGCDITQGYFFSRPLPAGQIPDWIATHRGVRATLPSAAH